MPPSRYRDDESRERSPPEAASRASHESAASSLSSTSAILEHIHAQDPLSNGTAVEEYEMSKPTEPLMRASREGAGEKDYDEEGVYKRRGKDIPPSKTTKAVLWLLCGVCMAGWLLALFLFLRSGTYKHSTELEHDPQSTAVKSGAGRGHAVTLESVLEGEWYPNRKDVEWMASPEGDDGMIMERSYGENFLSIKNVHAMTEQGIQEVGRVLMKESTFETPDEYVVRCDTVAVSPDWKKVLVGAEKHNNWRHSTTAKYFVYHVDSKTGEHLSKDHEAVRMQLAKWAPTSDAIAFVLENNIYVRNLTTGSVKQLTTDGGSEVFYGVPDWVYEEEVFAGPSATWWSEDGKYLAFLRTNETQVPDFGIQYYIDRPSQKHPEEGLEAYPEEKRIKYPKAGAPNPVVDLRFYDVAKGEVFSVDIKDGFADDDRLITEVVWAGREGKVLVRQTNRVSDLLQMVLYDMRTRKSKVVREVDVNKLDGGWMEVSEETTFVPSDPANGRPHSGYVDTVIHEGYDHLAYFTPLDNPKPRILTSGKWEVVKAPDSIDLKNNLVYFRAAKRSPITRHVYSVKLDGTGLKAVTPDDEDGFYDVKFSAGSGYALLTSQGPGIPEQRIISTESARSNDRMDVVIEKNHGLRRLAARYDLPINVYSTVNIDGYDLQVIERRPPHFSEKKKYPVLFHLYGGPGSQLVNKKFTVDFQSYVASSLGYIVVTVDGRGTGFSGRKLRTIVRGNIGHYEANDQIETAKIWGKKPYVDEERMAIWGWSYGGFMTLKTLELDAGKTFKYGMAVAPVTDWRYYDSIYTERYMNTPQNNPEGYDESAIHDVPALASNVRFLVMHGSSDDNVHFQNSLNLIDRLNLARVTNFDFLAFPDSDHSIFFHNGNEMVYGRLSNWLVNAFNGEWLKLAAATPKSNIHIDNKE